jgi:predicted membrane metal-binding protein
LICGFNIAILTGLLLAMSRPLFGLRRSAWFVLLAMTRVNPVILWDVGFQLSFAATLGLMLYVGPWSRWTQNNLQRIAGPETASRLTRTLSEVILATMVAMLLTLPLIYITSNDCR